MLYNIFNSFNPVNFVFLMSFILNLLLSFVLMNFVKYELSKFIKMTKMVMITMLMDFSKSNQSFISVYLILMLMFTNMIMNTINLLPFSFCLNSQIYYFFSFSLIIWLSVVINLISINYKKMLLHLVPLGCPMMMSFFMVLIELISNFIRPITLSVRMSANLLAGHLLIHLVTEFSFFLFLLKF